MAEAAAGQLRRHGPAGGARVVAPVYDDDVGGTEAAGSLVDVAERYGTRKVALAEGGRRTCVDERDWPGGGYTHHAPGDVALLDTLDGWTVHVPGHSDEVEAFLRAAAATDDRVYVRLSTKENSRAHARSGGGFEVLRRGSGPTVVAVGPMLDPVLEATAGLEVTVLYAATVRPFDAAALRAALAEPAVVLVEPYLRGTSASAVNEALSDVPHRLLALGVPRHTARIYGEPADHDVAYGLDPAGLRAQIAAFAGPLATAGVTSPSAHRSL